MGRSSSKSELPETLPSDELSDSTGPSVVCTCRFREASFCRPWASASKSTPPYLDHSTRPAPRARHRCDHSTIFSRSLTRVYDLLRQSPPVGRLWTSSGMCVGSTDRSSAKRDIRILIKSIGHQKGDSWLPDAHRHNTRKAIAAPARRSNLPYAGRVECRTHLHRSQNQCDDSREASLHTAPDNELANKVTRYQHL